MALSQGNQITHFIALFIVAFAAVALVPSQVITMDKYIANIVFLSAMVLLLIAFFKKKFVALIQKTSKQELVLLPTLSVCIHLVLSYGILHYLGRPILPFDSQGTSFLLMNNFFVWAKPLEIAIQQLLIILLVTKLYRSGMSLKRIILFFVFGFGLIHIFQIFKTNVIVGFGFTFFAIIASFIFPYLLLRVRNGYIYNFMIHLVVYDVAALIAWALY